MCKAKLDNGETCKYKAHKNYGEYCGHHKSIYFSSIIKDVEQKIEEYKDETDDKIKLNNQELKNIGVNIMIDFNNHISEIHDRIDFQYKIIGNLHESINGFSKLLQYKNRKNIKTNIWPTREERLDVFRNRVCNSRDLKFSKLRFLV